MQNYNRQGFNTSAGGVSHTDLPAFARDAVSATITTLVYESTAALAQLCRATGRPLDHALRRYMLATFTMQHPAIQVDAGVFVDLLHNLHADTIRP